MVKTALSYYGGKQKIAGRIIPYIYWHMNYVEPFFGGGSVFFNKPLPEVKNTSYYREVINDKDERLINFYIQLRDNGEELCERLTLTPYSEYLYKYHKDLNKGSDMDRAVSYWVRSQQSFANGLNKGWGRGKTSLNNAYNYMNKVDNLIDFVDRLRRVYISCTDALTVIQQFDTPQTFYYLDPPYPNTAQGHYKGYTIKDYQNLVDLLDTVQGSFLLSNYFQEEIIYPSDWELVTFKTVSTVEKTRSKKGFSRLEHLYMRNRKGELKKEAKDVWDRGVISCFRNE